MSNNATNQQMTPEEQNTCLLNLDAIRIENQKHVRSKNDVLILVVLVSFIASCLIYLVLPEIKVNPLNQIYIEMAIFLFSVIAGFTISRQNNRYRQIIEEITSFDGSISAIYREFGFLSPEYQEAFKCIAVEHYRPLIQEHKWDFNIRNKSSTLTHTYDLLQKATTEFATQPEKLLSIEEIKRLLSGMQLNRKDMIALHAERMPQFQWFVIYFLAAMLILTISSESSYGLMIESLLKASFFTSIVATIVMLHRLDTLDLFESFLGEHSAQDVIDIFDGKR